MLYTKILRLRTQ